MIPERIRTHLHRLHAACRQGRSHRSIAREFGCDVRTVKRYAALPIEPCVRDLAEEEHPPATRCPGCGGMVYVWPCLLCQKNHAEDERCEIRRLARRRAKEITVRNALRRTYFRYTNRENIMQRIETIEIQRLQAKERDTSAAPKVGQTPACRNTRRRCKVPSGYQIVVTCRDERDQEELYNQLRAQNRACRLLVL